ncbi:hypothetical protein BH11PSE11_BH11PSE11_19730 [soil metagenome]
MRKAKTYVLGGVALLMVIGLLTDQPSWECSANMRLKGAEYGKGYSSVSMSAVGSISSSGVGGNGETFIASLNGRGNFSFEYSPNITHVQLKIDKQAVYEGLPIAQFNKPGVVAISLRWTGTEVSVAVKDRCSFGSIVRGLAS